MDLGTIEHHALQLSEADRALLAERLLQSIAPVSPHAAAWEKEARARDRAFQEGKIEALDGETALAALRAKLRGE